MRIEIGSDEWKKIRSKIVTATDAPIIMGVSPWCTASKLMEKKVMGIESEVNAAMQRGLDLEEIARHIFEKDIGELVFPEFRIGEYFDWLAATFDGINDKGTLVEIKCPGEKDHNEALNGYVPTKYYPQLQTQMIVGNVKSMWYVSYRPEDEVPYIKIPVVQDPIYCANMMEKLSDFYLELMDKTTKDYEYETISECDSEIITAEMQYLKLQEQIKEAEAKMKPLRDFLISKCNGKKSKGQLLKYTPISCKGSVDYSSIPELGKVNLEMYRKPPSVRWNVESI